MTRLALLGMMIAASAALPAGACAMNDEVPRARDGNVAIQQELDAARRAATLEAYDLFLARHPGHRLEAVARQEREALRRRLGSPR